MRLILILTLICFSTIASEKGGESLTEQLQARANRSAKKAPQAVKDTMNNAIEELKSSQVMKSALRQGAQMPAFALEDVKHGLIKSADLLKRGPLLVVFYRGGWCPYCNLQLRDLQKHLKSIQAQGAQLVAISPQTPDSTAGTVKKGNLGFYVLSDNDGAVAKKFGLMYKLNKELIALYKKFEIDLENSNGNKDWELPISATYIVNQSGKITYSFVDADYKKRPETSELVKLIAQAK